MSIPFVTLDAPHYGDAETLEPGLVRVIADNPGPFTYTGTGVYIVGAGDTVAIIDPGPNSPAHLAALKSAIDEKRVSHILLTHHHADHSPAAEPLSQAYDCPIYGMRPRLSLGETSLQMDEGDDPNFAPDITIRHGDEFCGPGYTLIAHHMPGHTSNHICFEWREAGALFSGDHIMGWATSVVLPPDGDMRLYMRSLKAVQALSPRVIYPTHGAPITKPAPFVDAYITHRERREAQIVETLSRGPAPIIDIVKERYAHVDKRLYPAAAMSVWSHLIKLLEDGVVTASGEADLSATYALKNKS